MTIRYSTCDFLFDFNRTYKSILYRFRVTASYLSKIADFNPPHLYLSPMLGVILFEYRRDLWCQKKKDHAVSPGIVCVILRLAVFSARCNIYI